MPRLPSTSSPSPFMVTPEVAEYLRRAPKTVSAKAGPLRKLLQPIELGRLLLWPRERVLALFPIDGAPPHAD